MNILGIWDEKFSLRYVPITLVQVVFCAGTVFVLSAVQATSGPRLGRVTLSTALSQVDQCIRYLSIVGKSWECANRVADILSGVLHDQLKPRLLMRPLDPVCSVFMTTPRVSSSSCSSSSPRDIRPQSTSNGSRHDESQSQQFSVVGGSASASTGTSKSQIMRDPFPAPSLQSSWSFPESFQLSSDSPGELSDFDVDGDHDLEQDHALEPEHTEMRDIAMDFGFQGMDIGIMGGQPLSNQPYITFGLPDSQLESLLSPLDAQQRPRQQPHQQQISLEFTAEEIAVMDQILRQQQLNSSFQAPH